MTKYRFCKDCPDYEQCVKQYDLRKKRHYCGKAAKPNEMTGRIRLDVDEQGFGTICVCALRYAMGRQTYMPGLVRTFVRANLKDICDESLSVMIDDCDFQRRINCYGDEQIDKPGWLQWEAELKAEAERRKTDAD